MMEKGVNKMLISDEYNYVFNKVNGNFARWGKTQEDDPTMAPFGPEILDIEVTTICGGVPNKEGIVSPCAFCYKSNGPKGINMSFETFKEIIDKLPYLEKIEIILENGEKMVVNGNDYIKTKNGTKKAKDLTEYDEITM